MKRKEHDITLMTEAQFMAKIDHALAQAARGEAVRQRHGESLDDLLQRCGYA